MPQVAYDYTPVSSETLLVCKQYLSSMKHATDFLRFDAGPADVVTQ